MGNFKNKTGNFTIVQNELVNDKRLSLREKGLFLYLASKPDGWSFSVKNTAIQNRDGITGISNAMKALEGLGLLTRKKLKDENGKFLGIEYTIEYNPAIIGKPNNGKAVDGKPIVGKTVNGETDLGKPANNSKTINSNTILSKKEDSKKEKDGNAKKSVSPVSENIFIFKDPTGTGISQPGRYPRIMEVYDRWYKDRTDIRPKIDGAEGKALKSIINYLAGIAKDRNPEIKEEEQTEEIIISFGYILKNWNKLEPFIQDQIKLVQINSNLSNIINQLKNGYSKRGGQAEKGNRAGTVATAFDKIDKIFSGK